MFADGCFTIVFSHHFPGAWYFKAPRHTRPYTCLLAIRRAWCWERLLHSDIYLTLNPFFWPWRNNVNVMWILNHWTKNLISQHVTLVCWRNQLCLWEQTGPGFAADYSQMWAGQVSSVDWLAKSSLWPQIPPNKPHSMRLTHLPMVAQRNASTQDPPPEHPNPPSLFFPA